LAPASGSWRNTVTVTGSHFSSTVSENEVYFDGEEAEIVSATETELVVRPWEAYVNEPQTMSVTVITNRQASNHHGWTALPSGTLRRLEGPYMTYGLDIAVSPSGGTAYIADRQNGVLSVDTATGRTTWLRQMSDGLLQPTA